MIRSLASKHLVLLFDSWALMSRLVCLQLTLRWSVSIRIVSGAFPLDISPDLGRVIDGHDRLEASKRTFVNSLRCAIVPCHDMPSRPWGLTWLPIATEISRLLLLGKTTLLKNEIFNCAEFTTSWKTTPSTFSSAGAPKQCRRHNSTLPQGLFSHSRSSKLSSP